MPKEDKKKETTPEQPQPPRAIVLIATPNNTGMRNEYSVNAMMHLGWVCGAYGVQIIAGTYDEHPISVARNMACEDLLSNDKITHIFFVDSDCVPDADIILRLLSYDVPVASGWYLSRKGSGLPVAFKLEESIANKTIVSIVGIHDLFPKWRAYKLDEFLTLPKDKKGLIQVDGVGAGCLLIKRDVLSHLDKPFFYEDNTKKYGFGEDLFFSLNCKLHGIPIYVDLNKFCKHWTWGLIDMRHVQALLKKSQAEKMAQITTENQKPPM
jgi:hypothetical protein